MDTQAIVLSEPGSLSVRRLTLSAATASDVVVAVTHSAISAGTERLFWTGKMPPFPGMGFPLVPGYETVGTVVEAGADSGRAVGDTVFVPGATCFGDVRGLFGGAASRLVVPGRRTARIDDNLDARGTLLALAATAQHAIALAGPPDLIVGNGALGRLISRLVVAQGGHAPTIWERSVERMDDVQVVASETDICRDYKIICDASGDPAVLDTAIAHLAPGGTVVLAGFYPGKLSFGFVPAFMREASIRIAAEWKQPDLDAVLALVRAGKLSLDGIVTHVAAPSDAAGAYRTAFENPACIKMVLDWTVAKETTQGLPA